MKRILSVVLVLSLVLTAAVATPLQVQVQAAQSGDYTFTITKSNSTSDLLGYTNYSNGTVYIPEKLGGLPILNIGPYAFANHTEIKRIIIPAKVGVLWNGAFNGCTKLTSVYFLGNAPTTGLNVFQNCPKSLAIFYLPGKTGFTNPWSGLTTYPELLIPPTTNTVTDKMNTISGTSESDWPVVVGIGKVKYKASVVSKKWKVTLPKKFAAGTKFTVGTVLGDTSSLLAMRFVLPAIPTVNKIKPNSFYVKGTATKGAMVYIRIALKDFSAKANAKTGAFYVKTAKIYKGNVVNIACKINGVFSELKEIIV